MSDTDKGRTDDTAFQGKDWFTIDENLASVYFLLDQIEALAEADDQATADSAAEKLARIFPLTLQAKRHLRLVQTTPGDGTS